ncbi:hypothetical protein SAMN04487820_112155 [Actinopolyspora mzabensis]|uniref:Uncharacterized protein n=1 Tax=Actinopolyspora mzabensis TaxID=995066 RepID=A0A1G9EMX2_ACTMZ|nr:hypothetical protein [Actinopolyspora mzabensis]SDK77438.1 hypothetical protein SAMN04487820_112155 [Actinopolyspora mzabensis]
MTPKFRRRPDGTIYPLEGGGGGKGKATIVAGGLALTVWATGGGGTGGVTLGGSGTSTASMSTADTAVVRTIGKNLSKARRDVTRGNRKRAWKRLGMRQGNRVTGNAVECVTSTYGQVREFFVRTPCRDLRRFQFPVNYENGTISVLVSRVRMRSSAAARDFRSLIDEHGTGDIRPVLPTVRFSGYHYDSAHRRSTVFAAETESRTGNVPKQVLDSTAKAAIALARSAG